MKRILILLLVILSVVLQCSCSRIDDGTYSKVSYSDDEYHFKITYPSSFTGFKKEYVGEDNEECILTFSESEKEKITVSCLYNPEDSFYNYITSGEIDVSRIEANSPSTVIYDRRDEKEQNYQIISATKKMIVTLEYKYAGGEIEIYNDKCDMLSFEFTLYANVPKENAFLSPELALNEGKIAICIPANSVYTLTPEFEQIPYKTITVEKEDENGKTVEVEVEVPDTERYKGVIIKNKRYFAILNSDITQENVNQISDEEIIQKIGNNAQNITFTDDLTLKEEHEKSRTLRFFECEYEGKKSFGTYMVLTSDDGEVCELIYAEESDISDGEKEMFEDMLKSVKFVKKSEIVE